MKDWLGSQKPKVLRGQGVEVQRNQNEKQIIQFQNQKKKNLISISFTYLGLGRKFGSHGFIALG